MILFILAGGVAACKDDPVTPKPGGKDSCDTCICDTCAIDTTDTTDTVIVTPNDTTSHDFTWTEYNLSGESSINGCWVFSDTEIWVLGRDLYKFKGGGFERITIVGSGASMFGLTPKDTWYVYYDLVSHFDGKTMQSYRLWEDPYNVTIAGEDGPFRAAWGTSSNDMFFVGDKGTIVHFDGTNWMKFPKVTQKNLRKVWGRSSNDVWAAGYNQSSGESVLLHYDGSTWEEINLSALGDIRIGNHVLNTVWTIDSAGHSIVVAAGSLVWRKTDDGVWRSDSGKVTNRLNDGGFVALYAIRGNRANDIMLSGAAGWIAHWNGKSWHQYEQLFNWGDQSYDTSPMDFKGNTAAIAGQKFGQGYVAIGRRVK